MLYEVITSTVAMPGNQCVAWALGETDVADRNTVAKAQDVQCRVALICHGVLTIADVEKVGVVTTPA